MPQLSSAVAAGMVTVAGTVRFISDLHLRLERPDLTKRFSRFLQDCIKQKIDALFILGDLFEYWIGDDNLDDPFIADVVAHMSKLSNSGITLFFMHGNRDFLIGRHFAEATGARLLSEQCVLEVADSSVGAGKTTASKTTALQDGRTKDALLVVADGNSPSSCAASINARYLLLHGDTLCTDDRAYQDFRVRVRSSEWQQSFLAQTLAARRAEVVALRRHSTEAVRHKSLEIMDVNSLAVRESLATSACCVMIHGHTHRPGCEVIDASSGSERWVLSDWDDGRGDAIELRNGRLSRLDWSH